MFTSLQSQNQSHYHIPGQISPATASHSHAAGHISATIGSLYLQRGNGCRLPATISVQARPSRTSSTSWPAQAAGYQARPSAYQPLSHPALAAKPRQAPKTHGRPILGCEARGPLHCTSSRPLRIHTIYSRLASEPLGPQWNDGCDICIASLETTIHTIVTALVTALVIRRSYRKEVGFCAD